MIDSTAALLRVLAIVAAIAALSFFGDRLVNFVRAPVQAQLDTTRGIDKGLKAGIDAQNAGVNGLQVDAKARQDRGKRAVAAAGNAEVARAAEILEAPPIGESDYERAVNRIDRELGLQ